MMTASKKALKAEIKALKVKAASLKEAMEFAKAKREACLNQSLLNASEQNRKTFERWMDKASDIGVEYYTVLDLIIELEEQLS